MHLKWSSAQQILADKWHKCEISSTLGKVVHHALHWPRIYLWATQPDVWCGAGQ